MLFETSEGGIKTKMKKLWKGKKALSPVVAAIILIAVTVAVSIAVAAWMGALTFTFMATEQISFTSVVYPTALDHANVTIKNTGTGALTIDRVLVNSYANSSSGGWTVMTSGADETLDPNEAIIIQIDPSKYPAAAGIVSSAFSTGDTYGFTVVTEKNNQFGPYTATASPS